MTQSFSMSRLAAYAWAAGLACALFAGPVQAQTAGQEKEEVNPRLVMRTWGSLIATERADHLRSWASLTPDKAEEYEVYDFVIGIVEDKTDSENLMTRSVAVETLERLLMTAKKTAFSNYIKRLIPIMEDSNQRMLIRRPVVRMMGRLLDRNNPQHVVHIVALNKLSNNAKEHELIRAEAITATGEIGRPEDMESLLNLIDDKNDEVRKAVFVILPSVIGSLKNEPSPAVIGKLRRLITEESADNKVRASVLSALASFIRKQLIDGRTPTILRTVVQETNKWIQTSTDKDMLDAAVDSAGKMGQTESIEPLIVALNDLQGEGAVPIRERICGSWGMFFEVLRKGGSKQDVKNITGALLNVYANQAETASVRIQAVYALSFLYYKELDKEDAYINLANYWNPNPPPALDPKLFYDAGLEEQVRTTLKIYTDSIDFGTNYEAWMDWGRKNQTLLRSGR